MNTVLDDISAVIGFTPTMRLAAWYGDTNLYVPTYLELESPLAGLIGSSAYAALVKEFGGKTLSIPHGTMAADKMQRTIAEMLVLGIGPEKIADFLFVSERRVWQIINILRERKLIALISNRTKNALRKSRGENAGANAGAKTPLEKPPVNPGLDLQQLLSARWTTPQ